jgi:hypothetical protein
MVWGQGLKQSQGEGMNTVSLDEIKTQLCGKRIVNVDISKWSGIVRPLSSNSEYITLTLDDGTILEVQRVFIHEE